MNLSTDKYCKSGKHWVNKNLFYKNRQHADGLQHYCIDCGVLQEKERQRKKKDGTIKAF